MKALILNSGLGTRMGIMTAEQPKCMTEISGSETILSRQLKQLAEKGITDVVITTGLFHDLLIKYCEALDLPLQITYVYNPDFRITNYIYSIYCAREYLDDDLILMHGDLVFENIVFDELLQFEGSCMAGSSTEKLPEKDFKAEIKNGKISRVGINIFEKAVAVQPLYKLTRGDWKKWLDRIIAFCESGEEEKRKCYAENAFNEISEQCSVSLFDIGTLLCKEVDDPNDLFNVSGRLSEIERRIVYMCFSADVLHGGHISIIKKASRYGRLIIGVLSDEAIAEYKRFPLVPYNERKILFENLSGVYQVVRQTRLSYRENLEKYKPDIVVHGDDWKTGFQKPVRDEVCSVLAEYGGRLIEFPYADSKNYRELEKRTRAELSLPDVRRGRLKRELEITGFVRIIEAHDGLTGFVAENTVVYQDGGTRRFDGMWVSSLCDSVTKGNPDIELVNITSRFHTVNDLMEVTTIPVIFDGETGGKIEHFVYTVRSLDRMGVSMVIIEDKTDMQQLDTIENFSNKISAGKQAQHTDDFMICARIDSLILGSGMEDALKRAFAYAEAGADAVMLDSQKEDPGEMFEFVRKFREADPYTWIAAVPTSCSGVKEEELKAAGVNIVIYSNQLIRAEVPAIRNTAKSILENHRTLECEDNLMPVSEIIRMIPGDI